MRGWGASSLTSAHGVSGMGAGTPGTGAGTGAGASAGVGADTGTGASVGVGVSVGARASTGGEVSGGEDTQARTAPETLAETSGLGIDTVCCVTSDGRGASCFAVGNCAQKGK